MEAKIKIFNNQIYSYLSMTYEIRRKTIGYISFVKYSKV